MFFSSRDNYISRRSPVVSTRGAAASSQPQATQAGIKILETGGSAADAAVAMAAALQVTEPCSTGLGGDAFCLYYDAEKKQVFGFNGSGRSPQSPQFENYISETLEKNVEKIAQLGPNIHESIKNNPWFYHLPDFSVHTVTVPGAPALWEHILNRYGNLTYQEVMSPAIKLAEEGFAVSPCTAFHWQKGWERQLLRHKNGKELSIHGRPPQPGEKITLPQLAHSLKTFAAEGSKPFYHGKIAQKIIDLVQEQGGYLSFDDFHDHTTEEVKPISVPYRGYHIWECPPNGQGLAALLALQTVREWSLAPSKLSKPLYYHGLIEAMRMAFADSGHRICDPNYLFSHFFSTEHTAGPSAAEQTFQNKEYDSLLNYLLSAHYAKNRASLINETTRIQDLLAGMVPIHDDSTSDASRQNGFDVFFSGRLNQPINSVNVSDSLNRFFEAGTDTVYFAVTDKNGNGCSFINSNFMGFGTGLVPEGCGFSLQNRGRSFNLIPGHPNCAAAGKRPYHTIIPGVITNRNQSENPTENQGHEELFALFGVMGGMMQPQGHLQVASALIDFELDPQAALDRPRFMLEQGLPDGRILMEPLDKDDAVIETLQKYGHSIKTIKGHDRSQFGLGQVILQDKAGVYWSGSDPRGDGCALGL